MTEWPYLLNLLTLAAIGLALVIALQLMFHALSEALEEKGIFLTLVRNRLLRALLIGLLAAAIIAAITLEFTSLAPTDLG